MIKLDHHSSSSLVEAFSLLQRTRPIHDRISHLQGQLHLM
jgi:hypothetical protein